LWRRNSRLSGSFAIGTEGSKSSIAPASNAPPADAIRAPSARSTKCTRSWVVRDGSPKRGDATLRLRSRQPARASSRGNAHKGRPLHARCDRKNCPNRDHPGSERERPDMPHVVFFPRAAARLKTLRGRKKAKVRHIRPGSPSSCLQIHVLATKGTYRSPHEVFRRDRITQMYFGVFQWASKVSDRTLSMYWWGIMSGQREPNSGCRGVTWRNNLD
jgi:hypothetical protein